MKNNPIYQRIMHCGGSLKKFFLLIIRIYQKTLSPDHGFFRGLRPYGHCRYYPSCSQYTYQAIERFGINKGSYLGIKRVLRCTPFHQPRVDNIPSEKVIIK